MGSRQDPSSIHIGFVGAALAGNRGAEAMIVSSVGQLEKRLGASCGFCVHSYFPEEDRRLLQNGRKGNIQVVNGRPVWLVTILFPFAILEGTLRRLGCKVPDALLPRGVAALRKCDIMLDLSGVSFCDGREKFLPFNFLNNWPLQWMGVPVVHLSQGKGPFKGMLNRVLARWVLGKCPAVFARGEGSRTHLDSLSLPGFVGNAADVAFCYDPSFSLFEENAAYAESLVTKLREVKKEGGRLFCLSVSAVVHRKCRKRDIDYIAMLSDAVSQLESEGYRVVILPNATRDDCEGDHNNDLPLVRTLVNGLRPSIRASVFAVEKSVTTATLHQVIAECDGMLASRFHAMIGALLLGVPVAVCGWGHKYVEVLQAFGMEAWALDFQKAAEDGLQSLLALFLPEIPSCRQMIVSKREKVIESSQSQFDWVCEYLHEVADG